MCLGVRVCAHPCVGGLFAKQQWGSASGYPQWTKHSFMDPQETSSRHSSISVEQWRSLLQQIGPGESRVLLFVVWVLSIKSIMQGPKRQCSLCCARMQCEGMNLSWRKAYICFHCDPSSLYCSTPCALYCTSGTVKRGSVLETSQGPPLGPG